MGLWCSSSQDGPLFQNCLPPLLSSPLAGPEQSRAAAGSRETGRGGGLAGKKSLLSHRVRESRGRTAGAAGTARAGGANTGRRGQARGRTTPHCARRGGSGTSPAREVWLRLGTPHLAPSPGPARLPEPPGPRPCRAPPPLLAPPIRPGARPGACPAGRAADVEKFAGCFAGDRTLSS